MSSLGGLLDVGVPLAEGGDDPRGVVEAQRRLREVGQLIVGVEGQVGHITGRLDDGDRVGRFAHGAHDFIVPFVPDEQDVVPLLGVADRLHVHLGDQRAGGVDHAEVTPLRLAADLGADAVGGEDDGGLLGHLVERVDEDHTLLLKSFHHVAIVHDLVKHIQRRADERQRLVDGLHRHVYAGAEAAGVGEQDLHPRSVAQRLGTT